MAVLGAHQRIDRVVPNRPFGDGTGATTIGSNTTQSLANASLAGSATDTAATLGDASSFANGDIVLAHQSRGTGVGQWEINKIVSGGGTTSITLSHALTYTFTDSGASQAQLIKIPFYDTATVSSTFTWSSASWDQNIGGIFIVACSNLFSAVGTVNGAGNAGSTSTVGTGKGFKGGEDAINESQGFAGEGSAAASVAQATANGNGGGGGKANSGSSSYASGGGGGNGAAGSSGGTTGTATAGAAGAASGAADLTTATFGGAGGGGGMDQGGPAGAGGGSGCLVFIFARQISLSGAISINGGAGGNSSFAGGGGGAGGSGLFVCETGVFGSNLATATGGAGGTGDDAGGAGAVGRFAVHHSGTITGTTNPTFTDVTDPTLYQRSGIPPLFF